jgi:alkanesulfonate monooxygenase SsuD/methylene tetrahydromethanopterin reductase-like flavin-dependent oxidoreductase (luciferase family)
VRLGFDSVWSAEELYLDGREGEAAGAVPDELVDEVPLVGPGERIAESLERWVEAGVDTLIVGTYQVDALRVLAEARG